MASSSVKGYNGELLKLSIMSDLTRTSAAVKGLAEVYSNYISNVLSRTMIKPVISYDWMILQSDVKKNF